MKSLATKKGILSGNGGILAAIAIIGVGLLLGLHQLNVFPAYVHAWSQSDWYSIAIGFHNNGFDFFHPETLIYNKQYPGWWKVAEPNTVTSVDFPLHEYLIALLMKLTGTQAPWVFRTWTLLCSLAGLWFLFLLCRRLTRSYLKAAMVVAVALFSPLYAYYYASFLPSAPALALAMAGLWAYVVYRQEEKTSYWHWAVALLALATLTRTSQAVVLVAVCGFELLRILRREVPLGRRWIVPLAAVVAIGGYLLWNAHLRSANGSMFRNTLTPPQSFSDVADILRHIKEQWRFVYFSQLQHLLVSVALLGAVATAFFKKGRSRSSSLPLWWLAAIWLFGELCFFVAMLQQFQDHDYYFLDSFYLPVLFTFALALGALPDLKNRWAKASSALLLVVACADMYHTANNSVALRYDKNDRAYQCSLNYADADQWLDSLGVSREARILSVFSYPQNSPFIQMGRRGYSLMWFDRDIIDSVMHFPFDYAVVEDEAFRDNFPWQKPILGRLIRISGNGRLSLCRMADSIVNQCADDFFLTPGYVGMRQGSFWLNGEPWFPVMLNYKAFIEGDRVVPAPWYTGDDIREHFDTIAAWGFNAVRVCLDVLDEEGDTAAMYRATRRMVQQADSAGLHVMLLIKPPFESHWRDYAVGLMHRLADLPALWAYDLLNEPLYFDPEPTRDKRNAVATVREWRDLVRTHAPHQLFTVATAEPIEVFEWDPSMLPVDFIEMHTYHPLRVQGEMWWYSHYTGKPWMVGETGLPADGDSVPYEAQHRFMLETYAYARQCGAIGYGWWEFQDCPEGVNFEAQYTGLRDGHGRRKWRADISDISDKSASSDKFLPPANYRNMLAYRNVAVTGQVLDSEGNPIEGAVIRGWNSDWSVGLNTFTDADGRFRLVSNDTCTHFEVSAPGFSETKFDLSPSYPAGIALPDRDREYQQIPVLGWGDGQHLLPVDSKQFEAPTAVEASIGTVTLRRL